MICEILAYTKIARFDGRYDPCKGYGQGEMGLVVKEFSKKSAYAQADLRAKFMGMKCLDKANPREFLEGLRMKM